MANITYLDRPFDWKHVPLAWQIAGRQETASGYGRKLTSTRVIRIAGETRWRRVYVVQFSNAGTRYVLIKHTPHYLRDSDFSVALEGK